MKLTGNSIFAAIPPTIPAALITKSGLNFKKNFSTFSNLSRSSFCLSAVMILQLSFSNFLTIADPASPFWPDTNSFFFLD